MASQLDGQRLRNELAAGPELINPDEERARQLGDMMLTSCRALTLLVADAREMPRSVLVRAAAQARSAFNAPAEDVGREDDGASQLTARANGLAASLLEELLTPDERAQEIKLINVGL